MGRLESTRSPPFGYNIKVRIFFDTTKFNLLKYYNMILTLFNNLYIEIVLIFVI